MAQKQTIITVDVLIVGAGPAGLAAGLELKKLLTRNKQSKSVMVIDKAPAVGAHILSGALFKIGALAGLLPAWRDLPHAAAQSIKQNKVKKEKFVFLSKNGSLNIPVPLLPPNLRNNGHYIISTGKLCSLLEYEAEKYGLDVYYKTPVIDFYYEDKKIKGVIVPGAGTKARQAALYAQQEIIKANIILLADGAQGTLSQKIIGKYSLADPRFGQIYSVGIKQLLQLSGTGRLPGQTVVHTLGYPLTLEVFGGGFIYSMPGNRAAIGLIMGMDWPYVDFNPQQELERFKRHPAIKAYIGEAKVIAAGAKIVPEGGFFALPQCGYESVLLLGDAAGLVNISSFKGLHLAINSGLAAAEAVFAYWKNRKGHSLVERYRCGLEARGVVKELFQARNFRQVFANPLGFLVGAPLSLVQSYLPLALRFKDERRAMRTKRRGRVYNGGMSREDFVFFTRTHHEEMQVPHVRVRSETLCRKCYKLYKAPCRHFCPGKVYAIDAGGQGPAVPEIQAANCLHDKSCLIKCPFDNIEWENPPAGQGPNYAEM